LTVPNDPDFQGNYYVIACADARNRLRESNEKNNCKPSSSTIAVVQPPPTSLPPATSYPGLQGSGSFSFSSSPDTLNFQVSFSQTVDYIEIWVPRGVTGGAVLSPSVTGCSSSGDQRQFNGQTYMGLACGLPAPLPPNTLASGNISMSPSPAPGMGGYLYGAINNQNNEGGPFTMTGP
jgi:hypothetical protein